MGLTLPYRVLVVEDDAFVRDWVATILRRRGYDVLEAENGVRACEVFQQHKPHAIISDIVMPEMDGYALCRKIRGDGHQIPFLFLTNLKDAEAHEQGIISGANDYLTKPVDPAHLEGRLWDLLRRYVPEPNQSSR